MIALNWSSLRRLCPLGIAVFVLGLFPVAASAATPAPHWSIVSNSDPANFIPGDSTGANGYRLTILNTGGAPSDGSPITITDTLPDGLTVNPAPSGGEGFHAQFGAVSENSVHYPCEIGPPVTCLIPSRTVYPGEDLGVFIPVNIAADAASTLTNQVSISGGGAPEVSATQQTPVSSEPPAFGFQSMDTVLNASDGTPSTQAGSHPYRFHLGFQLNTAALGAPAGSAKDVLAKLPPGLVLNPAATPVRCTEIQLETKINGFSTCPDAAAVGLVQPTVNPGGFAANLNFVGPIYNMVPPPGVAAEFAFDAAKIDIFVHILGGVDSSGDYALTGKANDILQSGGISGVGIEFWGNPSDPSHDRRRGGCGDAGALNRGLTCPVPATDTPLITMPTSCSGPLTTSLAIAPWEDPANPVTETAQTLDADGNPVGVEGCNALEFNPTLSSQPTTNLADAPTGLDVKIHQPQNEEPEGFATAALKDAKVTLPQGMTLNPSAGNGLAACTNAQIGYQPKERQIHFSDSPQSCHDAAKVGNLQVSTPLLEEKLGGSIYLAKPYENPFGSLLAIYLAVEDKKTGIIAKLAGEVTPDPQTGQLTALFKNNPQLPIEEIETHFFNGPKAALKTPLACGRYTTTTTLTPWSTPEGADVNPSDSFQTSVAAAGSGPCPTSEAGAPNKPAFTAGTTTPQAAAFSPFVLKLSREDGSQQLTGLNATLPQGLTGKLAGIPYCSEAQIAQAKSREKPNQGAVEQASPSCPLASEVGSVTVGAGAGITPLYVGGHAYLAGPYKGAPISLVIITPAVAGPFDLGAVVARTALYVNSETAQIHAVSDPLPSIIQGIPLDLRSIALKMDRPDFTLNPTSCDPTAITGAAATLAGQSAALTSPFQVGGCSALKFKPNLALSLKGATRRTGHPALRAVLTYPKGQNANVSFVQVTLPHSSFLDTTHIKTICTRVQFAADTCPKGAIYGFARAFTPLLDKPVEGPVYLRSSDHKLPDLVAALSGQVDVDLVGRVDTGKGDGIRNTFQAAPDAPVSKFVLEMKGGKKGLLVNSEDICSKPQRAIASYRAHNGMSYEAQPLIRNSCGKKAKKKHKGKKPHRAQR